MDEKKTVTDPMNSMQVRFTDNSAKENEGDFYPAVQVNSVLETDASGFPYALYPDIRIESPEPGQDEWTDAQAMKEATDADSQADA